MNEHDVIEVLECLEAAGVDVCVDGGWGVDALIGSQTREHRDLDLALDQEDVQRARLALEERGFRHDAESEPGVPTRLVLRDTAGRQVDFHPLVIDDRGDGWQQLSASGKAWGRYPADAMRATGAIAGHQVRCVSPELQLRFHLGYEWTEGDEHDLALLVERFDLSRPPGLAY